MNQSNQLKIHCLCSRLGGLGQLGLQCAKLLRQKYGEGAVILSDIIKPSREISESGPYIFADILDFKVGFLFVRNSVNHLCQPKPI